MESACPIAKFKRFHRVYNENDCTFATMFLMLVEASDNVHDNLADASMDEDKADADRYCFFHEELLGAFAFIQGSRCAYGYGKSLAERPKMFVYKRPGQRKALQRFKYRTGRKIFLLTNADWDHTQSMMTYTYGSDWRTVFDLVIVKGRKKKFFDPGYEGTFQRLNPETGKFSPMVDNNIRFDNTTIYSGGNAAVLNEAFAAVLGRSSSSGPAKGAASEVLYIGDSLLHDVVNPRRLDAYDSNCARAFSHSASSQLF